MDSKSIFDVISDGQLKNFADSIQNMDEEMFEAILQAKAEWLIRLPYGIRKTLPAPCRSVLSATFRH